MRSESAKSFHSVFCRGAHLFAGIRLLSLEAGLVYMFVRPRIQGKKGRLQQEPLRKRTIRAYITSNYPALVVADDKLNWAIEQERIACQRLQRDASEATKARKMSMADLQRKSRSLATQSAAIDHAWKEGAELPPILTFEVNGRQYQKGWRDE